MDNYKYSNDELPYVGAKIKVILHNGFTFLNAEFIIFYKGIDAIYEKNDYYIKTDNGLLFKWSDVKSWEFKEFIK